MRIECKVLQFLNAYPPIFVIVMGRVIEAKEVQPLKASSPIVFTLFPKMTETIFSC